MLDLKLLPFPLRPKQSEANGEIQKGKSVLACLPTGYVKLFIAILAAHRTVMRRGQFILLGPLKALVDEHTAQFKQYFPKKILELSGDYSENKKKISPFWHGYVMTYEMLYQFVIKPMQRKAFFHKVKCIIIDECHLLNDPSRGAIIESMIYLIRRFYPAIQWVMLSATIANQQEFADHFHCALVSTDHQKYHHSLQNKLHSFRRGIYKRKKVY